MKAPFIVVEGIDGSGKSSQIAVISTLLEEVGFKTVLTREPGGTLQAESIRAVMKTNSLLPETQLLMAFAARNEHINRLILPTLEKGMAVISDRFTESSYAYQGGLGVNIQDIENQEKLIQKGFKPDVVLYFDIPAEIAEVRRKARNEEKGVNVDDFDNANKAFFDKAIGIYKSRAKNKENNYLIINGNQPKDNVSEEIKIKLGAFLANFQQVHQKKPRMK